MCIMTMKHNVSGLYFMKHSFLLSPYASPIIMDLSISNTILDNLT